jgi:choline dehydrogenase-like flavoprotein
MAAKADYDFLIIGSGSSGGVLAGQLQQAGAKCVLLEAGQRYTAKSFPQNEAIGSAQLLWNGGLDLDTRGAMAFLRGRCVGGGSVVNQALMNRLDREALESWRAVSGIDSFSEARMDRWYTRAENGLALREIGGSDRNRNARIFEEGHKKHGLDYVSLRRAQSDCATDRGNDCMACLNGCHRGSKQDMSVTYIARGEQAGLKIVSEFLAERLECGSDVVTVYGHRGDRIEEFSAKKAILACGALGTPQLLLNSGFGERLPALGRHFTAHPQQMCFGIFEERIDAHKGAFQALASSGPEFKRWRFKLENVFAPPGAVAMIAPMYGAELLHYMKKYRNLACIEVALRAETEGTLRTDKSGRLQIEYSLCDADKRRGAEAARLVTQMLEASGAERVVKTWLQYCLHLMGGCVIGTDGKDAVVNEQFQVYDHEDLYIADSSIFPNAPGINPALTIMALSHQLADALSG